MKMDRTRIIFVVIIAFGLLATCGIISYNLINSRISSGQVEVTAVSNNGQPSQETINLDSPEPIWGPNYDPNDGLPTYVCGADAFGSYFTLQQMQMSGLDMENGFHLGIVPFDLTDEYTVTEDQRTALLDAGQWDCLLTTLDSVALSSPGVITAIVDESAGADQL
ncbi:MAG TPA: hypothetical protein EYH05_02460, partial [Anaerolineae bacterium]|nr:hypothetical protein [Anaerolineae bacterium]